MTVFFEMVTFFFGFILIFILEVNKILTYTHKYLFNRRNNMYNITIYLDDTLTKKITHKVQCDCPIDWVISNYHHESFFDFTYYAI